MADGFHRTDRLASLIQNELAILLRDDVRDPDVEGVAVSGVDVTRDLGIAKVYYLVIGLEEGPAAERVVKRAGRGLERASGFLRRQLGQRLTIRNVPELRFYWDESVSYGRKMETLLADLAKERGDSGGDES